MTKTNYYYYYMTCRIGYRLGYHHAVCSERIRDGQKISPLTWPVSVHVL